MKADSRIARAALAAAAAFYVAGCGGGSPSDIVLPSQVDVTLTPVQEPVPRTVGLELAGTSARDLSVRVSARELEAATGVAFELRYDPQLLEFQGSAGGSFFGTAPVVGARVVESEPGRLVGVAAGMDQAAGRDGSGDLVTLRFELLRLRDSQTTLEFGRPQSLVYGPDGPTAQHAFTDATLVTRIRAPS